MDFQEFNHHIKKTFGEFHYKEVEFNKKFLIAEANFHNIFRHLHAPVRMMFSTSEYVEKQLSESNYWLDQIYKEFKGRAELFLFFISSKNNRIKSHLEGLQDSFVKDQPIIPLEKLNEKGSFQKIIKELILTHVNDAKLLNPYQTDESTSVKMFYGRENEIEKICQSGENTFLYGARRIGKSSLAAKLKEKYGHLPIKPIFGNKHERFETKDREGFLNKCSYVDLSVYGINVSEYILPKIIAGFNLNSVNLYKSLARKITPEIVNSTKEGQGFHYDDLTALENFLKLSKEKPVIILDEVDTWIERESMQTPRWATINQLRGLTDEGKCKVILIGYENLLLALQNSDFPFYERGKTHKLEPLTKDNVTALVLDPMKEFNIKIIHETRIIDRIWDVTSGLPHLVQDICKNVVNLCFRNKEFELNNPVLTDAINESQALQKFRNSIFKTDFPLALAIFGVLTFNTFKDDNDLEALENLPKEETSMKISEIIQHLKSSGLKYDSKAFDFALLYLELMSLIKPLSNLGTTWTWNNLITAKMVTRKISEIGFDNWKGSVISEHNAGKWKEKFRIVGGLHV